MTPTDLRALAARVVAEEPSRELDADIWDAIGLTPMQETIARGWCGQNGRTRLPRREYLLAWSSAFTSSHDAAFGLVPTEWRILAIEQTDDGYTVGLCRSAGIVRNVYAPARSLQRAVTAASLMARSVGAEQEGTL